MFFIAFIPCSARYYDDDGRFADEYEFDEGETESADEPLTYKELICTLLLSFLIIPLFFLILHLLDR